VPDPIEHRPGIRRHGVGRQGYTKYICDRIIALGYQIGSKGPGVGTGERDGYFQTIARNNIESFPGYRKDLAVFFFAWIMTEGFILVIFTSASTWV